MINPTEIDSVNIDEIGEFHRDVLFSDRPWLAVIHRAVATMEDAHEVQSEVAENLGGISLQSMTEEPFSGHGQYWHNDGEANHSTLPIANMFTIFGLPEATVYLARAQRTLDMPRTVSRSEQHIIQGAKGLIDAGYIREPIVRIGSDNKTTIIWREVDPATGIDDVAHAVYAESSGRRSAVSEWKLN